MSADEPPARKTLGDHAKRVAALPGEKFAELKAFGAEKLDDTLAAFIAALPPLKRAGYDLREFEVELGITPKIVAHFMATPASEDDKSRAQSDLVGNKVGASMLAVLRRASEMRKLINVPGFGFAHMEIDVGLIPAVRLRYRADDAGP